MFFSLKIYIVFVLTKNWAINFLGQSVADPDPGSEIDKDPDPGSNHNRDPGPNSEINKDPVLDKVQTVAGIKILVLLRRKS